MKFIKWILNNFGRSKVKSKCTHNGLSVDQARDVYNKLLSMGYKAEEIHILGNSKDVEQLYLNQ